METHQPRDKIRRRRRARRIGPDRGIPRDPALIRRRVDPEPRRPPSAPPLARSRYTTTTSVAARYTTTTSVAARYTTTTNVAARCTTTTNVAARYTTTTSVAVPRKSRSSRTFVTVVNTCALVEGTSVIDKPNPTKLLCCFCPLGLS